jgi:hypothetical protein
MDDADHLEISGQQHDPHHHDRNFPSPIRIVVEIECGLVQTVYSESFADVRVAIKDMDVEGADGDEIAELDDGTEFVGHIESAYRNDTLVERVFSAFGEESITTDKQQESYVARKGQYCPNCGSANIAGGPNEADGDEGISETHCFNCKSTWKDQFRLVGFTGLEATPLKVIKSVSERGYLSSADGWVFDVASAIKHTETNPNILPTSSGDGAEYVGLESAEDFLSSEFSVGDQVYWNDPGQGQNSGIYTIAAISTENGKLLHGSDVCILKNKAGSEVQVLAHKLG